MIKKSRQKFKYLENEKSFYCEIKSIFHFFKKAFRCQKLSQTLECAFKIYFLKIRIDSVNQTLRNKEKVIYTCNTNILTRITDRKILSVCSCLSIDIKNRGPGPYNFLIHTQNRKYFFGLSLTWNRREARTIHLVKEVGKIPRCSCWEKDNSILIYELKYGQT